MASVRTELEQVVRDVASDRASCRNPDGCGLDPTGHVASQRGSPPEEEETYASKRAESPREPPFGLAWELRTQGFFASSQVFCLRGRSLTCMLSRVPDPCEMPSVGHMCHPCERLADFRQSGGGPVG